MPKRCAPGSLAAQDTRAVRRPVDAMQARLAERLGSAPGPRTWATMRSLARRSRRVPRALASLFAAAEPVDGSGWFWRLREHPVWITRPPVSPRLGPRMRTLLDAALLAHLATRADAARATLFLVSDSFGHEATVAAESLCVSQYLAQHAAVLALLRARNVHVVGLLTGSGHSAAFFSNALQAPRVYALAGARVVAMEPAAIARVTRLDEGALAARIEDDPLVGHPVRHFAAWGGIAEILPDVTPNGCSRWRSGTSGRRPPHRGGARLGLRAGPRHLAMPSGRPPNALPMARIPERAWGTGSPFARSPSTPLAPPPSPSSGSPSRSRERCRSARSRRTSARRRARRPTRRRRAECPARCS